MHAIDRLAGIHELVQGLQHQPVAAKRDNDIGFGGISIAIALFEPRRGLARFWGPAGDEGNVLKRLGLLAHSRDLPMERAVLVYTTWPSIVEAERAGRSIVERRLAACVNILPGMISHYWWGGKIERAEGVVMLIKGRVSMAEPLREAVKQLHSYMQAAFMDLQVEDVYPEY